MLDIPMLAEAAPATGGSASSLAPLLMGVGGLLLGVVLLGWGWRRAGGAARQAPADPDDSAGVVRDARELTLRLASELDRRAASLEALIARADERLAALERAVRASPDLPPSEPSADPASRRVYDLADQGLPIVEIARRVDRPTGQVELILALRRGRTVG